MKNPALATHSEKYTYSDLLLDYLLQINVGYIFGIPGGAIEPLFDAVARNQRRKINFDDSDFAHKALNRKNGRNDNWPIEIIVARHEAGAVFMADGYYRQTGKLGVCCATTGPGSTNLITGIATAFVDHIPMLVITPQNALPKFGKRSFQDSSGDAIDIVAMLEPCTRYNSFVSHPEQLEGKLFEAIYTAFQEPGGPVHLSIPMDVLSQLVEKRKPSFHLASMLRQPKYFDEQHSFALAGVISQSEKIALYLGEGCLPFSREIQHFAELIQAHIVTTPTGKGAISSYHPLFKGVFGFAGHHSAKKALQDANTVLAIGSALGEFETGGWCKDSLLNEKLVHIDACKEHFAHSPMAKLHVYGHIGSIIEHLIKTFSKDQFGRKVNTQQIQHLHEVIERKASSQRDCEKELPESRVKPQYLMCKLSKTLPKETRYYIDTGNSWAWATHYLDLKQSGTYNISMGFGAMGWAIGASVGAAIGEPIDPLVCITGDGAYLMSGQEITVAVEHNLPVLFIILNDQALGMIKHGQRLGGGERIAYQLPKVNFAMMANAVGAKGLHIKNIGELLDLDFEHLLKHQGPILLDVHIDSEEVPPMGSRMKVLDRNGKS